MRVPYQELADNATLTLTLDNRDRYLSPENANSPIYGKVRPQVPVRIVSDDGTERVMWTGWIQHIKPTVGRYGERMMKILCSGAAMFYRATETKIALQDSAQRPLSLRKWKEIQKVLYAKAPQLT